MRIARTFTVDRAPQAVVDYLADFTNTEQWDPGTQSCTRIDDGPVRPGATWHNVSKVLGRETALEYRLERLETEHITFVGRNKTATSTDDITVAPHGAGSTITYVATIELHGLATLALPVMKLAFERLGDETVKGITSAVSRLPQ